MSVTRREFIVLSSAAIVAIPGRRLLFAQQAPAAPPQTSFDAIRANVGIFNGRGGTIGWLSNKDALIVIDSQFPDTAKICLDGLKQKAGRGVDVLINTHHHADHTAGNSVFKPETKKIVAHARVPALLQQQAAAQPAPPSGTPAPPPVPPDTTFEKTWTENAGDEKVTATYYGPGHTGGDAIIYFQKANVAHMGDLLFHERHPFVDRPAGANIQNWIRILETVSKGLPADTVYIAGHSKTGTPVILDRAAVLTFRDYLSAALSHVRAGLAAKKSREEIVALAALPKFEGYMEAPPRLTLAGVLGVAYDELTAK